MAEWKYVPNNQTYTNCALPYNPNSTSFIAKQPWCYVVNGNNCPSSMASSAGSSYRWKTCETDIAKKPDPCSCQTQWKKQGSTVLRNGCNAPVTNTPDSDTSTGKWCYVTDGYNCVKSMASSNPNEERKWLNCPSTESPGLTCVAPEIAASAVAKSSITFESSVKLTGVTKAQFTATVRQVFRSSVANGLKSIYPSLSYANVMITSPLATRRTELAVTFTVYTGSTDASLATSAQTGLTTYLNSAGTQGFIASLQQGLQDAGVATTAFPVTATTGAVTTATTASSDSSSGGGMLVIIIAVVVVVGIVAFAGFYVATSGKPRDKGVTISADHPAVRGDGMRTTAVVAI